MIALKPLLDGPTFSRLRLYESDSNTFQAEIGRDIDVLRGHHEFSTSELAYGSYFLVGEWHNNIYYLEHRIEGCLTDFDVYS